MRGPHYRAYLKGYARTPRWRHPRRMDRESTEAFALTALRAHRPRHALRVTGWPRPRPSVPDSSRFAGFDDPFGDLVVGNGDTSDWVGLPCDAGPMGSVPFVDGPVVWDGSLGSRLGLGRPTTAPGTAAGWLRFESVEHRVYILEPSASRPLGTEGATGVLVVQTDVEEVRLDAYLADVGEAVEFDPEHVGWTDSLVAKLSGAGLADAFLALDLHPSRYPVADETIARFFELFGAPPEIAGIADSDWSPGHRFLSLRRMRELRAALRRDSSDRTRRPDPALVEASLAGQIVEGATGEPVLEVGLWDLVAIEIVSLARRGRLGYCEAPLPHSAQPCAKPFIRQRAGRGRFCSDTCRARVHWRRRRRRGAAATDPGRSV